MTPNFVGKEEEFDYSLHGASSLCTIVLPTSAKRAHRSSSSCEATVVTVLIIRKNVTLRGSGQRDWIVFFFKLQPGGPWYKCVDGLGLNDFLGQVIRYSETKSRSKRQWRRIRILSERHKCNNIFCMCVCSFWFCLLGWFWYLWPKMTFKMSLEFPTTSILG